ncbi:MAG: methyltransferase domain-containing protein, partial [Anaerolineae bacterium]|nr:methyltransferase domain-containing protein [Anaerolineae bacterium]
DAAFDLVACMEALEFLPHPHKALAELSRVLRPGGWLLITNRYGSDARFFPGRIFSTDMLLNILRDLGMVEVEVQKWQVDYDLVWARKGGEAAPPGALPTPDLVRCPACGAVEMIPLKSGEWVCGECERRAPVGEDGVVDLFRLK